MGSDGGYRAALPRPQRGPPEVLHRDLAQHRFLAGVGLRAKRRAFEHLAGEVSEPIGEALTYRRRRKDGAVAAAAADDDIGAPVEQLDVGVPPGPPHDTVGSAEGRQVDRRPSVEPVDRVARRDLAAQIVLTDLRVEIADAEPRQAVLAGEVLYDADEPVDPAIAAGVGGRADDHRHAEPARPQQHVLQIVSLPLRPARRDVPAERPRTDIADPEAEQIRSCTRSSPI